MNFPAVPGFEPRSLPVCKGRRPLDLAIRYTRFVFAECTELWRAKGGFPTCCLPTVATSCLLPPKTVSPLLFKCPSLLAIRFSFLRLCQNSFVFAFLDQDKNKEQKLSPYICTKHEGVTARPVESRMIRLKNFFLKIGLKKKNLFFSSPSLKCRTDTCTQTLVNPKFESYL